MIEVFLVLNGNAAEAANYYSRAFRAQEPYMMKYSDMPEDPDCPLDETYKDLVAYAMVDTFAGQIALSDNDPGVVTEPNSSFWISVSSEDEEKLRESFNALAADGEVIMPMEPAFFSPLYGQVKDKFGFYWMFLIPDENM
ncbi:VOC family protein [Microaceticoccus formicicus]|uniref:VOC family protein n=1 Tax=Microaceticoccus formicicus TaxID=3118105 RepID=UPI003CD03A66|nr:VOC family protein [Peptoniphilaceae bacterium AMB_02]